jgi:hypothetical protein
MNGAQVRSKRIDQSNSQRFIESVCTGLVLWLTLGGCSSRQAHQHQNEQEVLIGAFQGSYVQAQQLAAELKRHGAELSFEGSIVFDVYVPAGQAERARTVLLTNHYTTEKVLQLLPLSK